MWALRLLRKRPIVNGKFSSVPAGPLIDPSHYFEVKLSEVMPISHDTKIYRFELPSEDQPLGLPLGQHITLRAKISTAQSPEGEYVERKYTPTSRIDEYGFFDIPIKIYNKADNYPEGGLMTQFLDSMQVGDKLEVSGPKGRMKYLGGGLFAIEKEDKVVEKSARHIGFIAAGSGITPCYQLIQYVAFSDQEDLNMSLLYANKTEEDIILRPILDDFVADQKLRAYYVLENAPENWQMGVGYVSEDHIKEAMPPPSEETLICHCGSKAFNQMVRGHLHKLGYSEDMLFKF